MPLIQGGPPEWIWERTPEKLKWELVVSERDGQNAYELRVSCGLEIVRVHFFSGEEIADLAAALADSGFQAVEPRGAAT
jgi:hypothetical protein